MKKYLIITEAYNVFQTDNFSLAVNAAEDCHVYDTEANKMLREDGTLADKEAIPEYTE